VELILVVVMKLIVRSHKRYLPLSIKLGGGAGQSYASLNCLHRDYGGDLVKSGGDLVMAYYYGSYLPLAPVLSIKYLSLLTVFKYHYYSCF
jgi:hypothetical protein